MFKLKTVRKNKGMTYVELITVSPIFSILSSVIMFDYVNFQDKVDLKNLASQIALQIVQAQKAATSGLLLGVPNTWRPSYGIYFFNPSTVTTKDTSVIPQIPYSEEFIYFADFNSNYIFSNDSDYSSCPSSGSECLNRIIITKNDYISRIDACMGTACMPTSSPVPIEIPTTNSLSITFTRLNSGANFYFMSGGSGHPLSDIAPDFDHVQITIQSPKNAKATISVYPSGRIQVN